jgi:hypothetical protein
MNKNDLHELDLPLENDDDNDVTSGQAKIRNDPSTPPLHIPDALNFFFCTSMSIHLKEVPKIKMN